MRFTSQNARQFAAKSAAVRRAAKLKREQALASIPASAEDQAGDLLKDTHLIVKWIDELILETVVASKLRDLAQARGHLIKQTKLLSGASNSRPCKPNIEHRPEARPVGYPYHREDEESDL